MQVDPRPRWAGEPDRIETWYATFSDAAKGRGYWFHVETVAPPRPRSASVRGWFAVFERGREPRVERFGPLHHAPRADSESGGPSLVCDGCTIDDGVLRGRAGAIAWDLEIADASPPLFTFPKWTWQTGRFPGSQVVPAPSALFSGHVDIDGERHALRGAAGALSRIYAHGHAQRWGWLHADLGEGDVLEIVSAVPRLLPLRRLSPLAFVQLRLGGEDWPAGPLLAAPRFRTELGYPAWTVRGGSLRRRLSAHITLPDRETVAMRYADPDGSTVICANSELASASIVLEERRRFRWKEVGRWSLDHLAHAEIGYRPDDLQVLRSVGAVSALPLR